MSTQIDAVNSQTKGNGMRSFGEAQLDLKRLQGFAHSTSNLSVLIRNLV
jgi:hypothetical protein